MSRRLNILYIQFRASFTTTLLTQLYYVIHMWEMLAKRGGLCNKTSMFMPLSYWSACANAGKFAVMYMCDSGIDLDLVSTSFLRSLKVVQYPNILFMKQHV